MESIRNICEETTQYLKNNRVSNVDTELDMDTLYSKYCELNNFVEYQISNIYLETEKENTTQISEQNSDEESSQISQLNSYNSSSQVSEQNSDEESSQVSEQNSDEESSEVSEQNSDEESSQVSEQNSDEESSEVSEKEDEVRCEICNSDITNAQIFVCHGKNCSKKMCSFCCQDMKINHCVYCYMSKISMLARDDSEDD